MGVGGPAPRPSPGCAPLPISWGRGVGSPAAHSQRQTLRAQLCPQQLLLPSVPPALKRVSSSQPPRERAGSVRAPRNQGTRPQDLGLLSTDRARVGAGFRELGALPGPCATVEREGGPLPPQDSSLSEATLSSWGMGRRSAPISLETRSQPKGRGHTVQPGKAVTHAIPPPQLTSDVTLVKGPCPSRLAEGLCCWPAAGWPPQRCWGGAEGSGEQEAACPLLKSSPSSLEAREAAPAGQADIFLPACRVATCASAATKATLEGPGEATRGSGSH